MKKTIILTVICLTFLCGCGKTPKLQNGEEAVITFKKDNKEHKISADELYEDLKNNYGLQRTVQLIDTYILESEFPDKIEEAKSQAKNYLNLYTQLYGGEDALLEFLQQRTNYSTISAYKESLYINVLEETALLEYAKTLVTDKEIEKHYNENVKEDIELYHILIKPKVTDGMSDEDKKEAEKNAKKTIDEIISKLDDANDKLATFKELVKEYSIDDASKEKDGNLGYITYGDLDNNYDELLDSAYKLKNGEYSKKLITTELGYHVIYRNSSKEKDKLENVKNDIVETLANEKIKNDSKLYFESLKYYRKLYNMNIIDSTLNSQYGIYMNNLQNRTN